MAGNRLNRDGTGPALRCLVTGATGYIGGRPVPELPAESLRHEVVCREHGTARAIPVRLGA